MGSRRDSPGTHERAVRTAHEVVGLYGDPDTTWGICLELGLAETVAGDDIAERLTALGGEHPHLGRLATPRIASVAEWRVARGEIASTPYGTAEPLVRVLLSEDGRKLFVGAHHGAVDGLGLVAVAAAAVGTTARSGARGIGDRRASRGFLRSSAGRVAEAIASPPPHFAGHRGQAPPAEDLREITLPATRAGTARLGRAVVSAYAASAPGVVTARSQPLLLIGASRRVEERLRPDRRTGYLRVRAAHDVTEQALRDQIAAADPEPDFPETSARGLGPRVTRLLRNRLGATALLSNLGVVEFGGGGAAAVESIAMYPATSGPRAVAVGLASTRLSTTVSLRTRRLDFTEAESAALLESIVAHFA